MSVKELREEVIEKISTADEDILRLINELMHGFDNELSDAHKKELDKRLARIERGETTFYSWEEAKKILKIQ